MDLLRRSTPVARRDRVPRVLERRAVGDLHGRGRILVVLPGVGQLGVVEDVQGGALGVGEGLGVAHARSGESGELTAHFHRHTRAGKSNVASAASDWKRALSGLF